jgi:hypothetical protein
MCKSACVRKHKGDSMCAPACVRQTNTVRACEQSERQHVCVRERQHVCVREAACV